jgi:hypothetical protein
MSSKEQLSRALKLLFDAITSSNFEEISLYPSVGNLWGVCLEQRGEQKMKVLLLSRKLS